MNPAGDIAISLRWDGRAVAAVEVASRRPIAATLFAGKTVDDVLALVPIIYAVCGRAQGVAARAAVAAARGEPPVDESRILLVEAMQEHLWRLLLDWPKLLGLPMHHRAFGEWYRRLAGAALTNATESQTASCAAFVESEVLGRDLDAWLGSEDAEALARQGIAGELLRAALDKDDAAPVAGGTDWLPELAAAETAAGIGEDWNADLVRRPVWRGLPAETGALARWHDHPAVAVALSGGGRGCAARLLARLLDLAQGARDLRRGRLSSPWSDATRTGPDTGVARVATARGCLLHRVRLDGGRIADYAVIAPTEWNFHPAGAYFQAMRGFVAADQESVRHRADCLALALDPCVPCNIEVVSA